jgi:predicted neuraminidase
MRAYPFLLVLSLLAASSVADDEKPLGAAALVKQEFIYEEAPFPECHASTIVETNAGLLCAWFGGTREGARDVAIWLSRLEQDGWTKPEKIADGQQPDGKQLPCWNPVLVGVPPAGGPEPPEGGTSAKNVTLFYKVGPSPSTWWGEKVQSHDGGRTWGKAEKLAKDYLGPVKNKPLVLKDGTLVCGSSTEHDGWRLHFELFDKDEKPLARVEPKENRESLQAIQPALLKLKDNTIVALCRPKIPGGIVETRSSDAGKNWSRGVRISLPNPGSGIDAVTLADGRHLIVYNHTIAGRSPLNIAVAADDKLSWQAAAVLENSPDEYSYPAVIQTADGLIHITYTWKRKKVRHVVLDPAKLQPRDFIEGRWPE